MASSKESTTNLQELEETVSRLSGHKGVEAVLMLNREGNILVVSGGGVNKDDPAATTKQAKCIKQLMDVSTKFIHCLDPNDTISFVQLRSKQHQVMLAPHNDYILAVLQDPLVSSSTPGM
jgi:dynein light chain roadblock-type